MPGFTTAASKQAAPDPVVADPKHDTVQVENEGARVWRIRYGPSEDPLQTNRTQAVFTVLWLIQTPVAWLHCWRSASPLPSARIVQTPIDQSPYR